MRFLLLIFSLLTITTLLSSCGQPQEPKTLQDQYDEVWSSPNTQHLVNIGRVLIKHNVKVCGEYYMRISNAHEDEYLIACTKDGSNWNYFQIWIGIDEVQQVADASLIPPTRD